MCEYSTQSVRTVTAVSLGVGTTDDCPESDRVTDLSDPPGYYIPAS